MRRLKYVPIIHTGVEMGSMYGTLKAEYIRKFGTQKWEEHNRIIEDFWQGIRKKIFDLKLDYQETRLYQDGLPVCGKEIAIVEELVKIGSHNHQILMELIRLGAKLEGTEDTNLLLEEYAYLKDTSAHLDDPQAKKKYQRLARSLLQKRDSFIRQRIDKTLQEGESGLLFIGISHRVNEKLPKDIEIEYVIYRLPFREGLFSYAKEN
jgi:hypothetical protein